MVLEVFVSLTDLLQVLKHVSLIISQDRLWPVSVGSVVFVTHLPPSPDPSALGQ